MADNNISRSALSSITCSATICASVSRPSTAASRRAPPDSAEKSIGTRIFRLFLHFSSPPPRLGHDALFDRASLFFVQTVDKAALVDLLQQTNINEGIGLGVFRLRVSDRKIGDLKVEAL